MLNKLIKYDFRSTWRDFAAIYLSILLGVTIFPLIAKNFSNNIINMFIGLIAFAIVVAVIVVTIGSLFKIFNKNVFSNEGYLVMTLPASATQIVSSKLIVSSLWIILTGAVSTVGVLIFVTIMSPESVAQMFEFLRQIFSGIDAQGGLAIALGTLFIIFSIIKEVAKLFLACSIAHLKQLNRFRIPAGILSYFLFTWIETVIVDLISWDVDFVVNNMESMMVQFSPENMQYLFESFNRAAGIGIGYQIGFIVLFGLGTVWLLNHKLDLD